MKWLMSLKEGFSGKKGGRISVLMFQDTHTRTWSAQCLEYDIATQAKSLDDLYYEIERMIAGYIVVSRELGLEPFEQLPAAPEKFWKLFAGAKIRLQRDPVPFRLPRPEPLPIPEPRVAELQPA